MNENELLGMVIAVDFDGTVVDHRFPAIGPDVPGAVVVLSELVNRGAKIILWTMRSGQYLDAAVSWYNDKGIPLFGVNTNPEQITWTKSPKAYANLYIDDAALGCPLVAPPSFQQQCVDWYAVAVRLYGTPVSEERANAN